jgi:hypothetical protein
MKRTWNFWTVVLLLLLALALPGSALAQGQSGDKFVFGGAYTLAEGETLDGGLYIFGGMATLQAGSHVTGEIVLFGGTLSIAGEVDGSVTALGGLVTLEETAVIQGDLSSAATHVQRAEGAIVEGKVITGGENGALDVPLPGNLDLPDLSGIFNPIWAVLWYLFRSFLWAALAVLVVLFLPRHTGTVSGAITSQPLICGGVGLLTVVVAPVALLIMTVTIILIPAVLLGLLLLLLAWAFGVIALGAEVGRRLALGLKQEWAPAVAAGVGTLLLSLVLEGVSALVPCIGWLAPALAGMLGLGAVLLTVSGTRPYPPVDPLGSHPGLAPVPAVPPPAAPPSPDPFLGPDPLDEPGGRPQS